MPQDLNTECIDACHACADACDRCATACLQEADVKAMADCIELDLECAAMCRLAAASMARGSEFAKRICSLCVLVCEACGEECGQHEHEHCQACAAACAKCADAYRQMVAV